MPEIKSEYDFEAMDASLTTRQRTDFTADRSALVDGWLSGKMPLDQAAAALRARIQKLPAYRPVGTKRVRTAKPKAAPATEATAASEDTETSS